MILPQAAVANPNVCASNNGAAKPEDDGRWLLPLASPGPLRQVPTTEGVVCVGTLALHTQLT